MTTIRDALSQFLAETGEGNRAKAGWSVTMEIARIKGKWGILGVGNVYP